MAQTIKVKRSAVAGKAPTTSDLELGELGLNTYDGKLYAKKDDGTESIVELSGVSDSAVTNAKVASNAAISGTKINPDFGSQNVTTTGTATAAALIPSGSSVPTNGVYLPSSNNVAISSSGSERIRIGANGEIGLSGANYGTSGQVLTSAGSGAAPTWSTVAGGGASVTTSDSAPVSPSDGDLWYDSVGGRLYVYYDDGNTSQWVDAAPQGGSAMDKIEEGNTSAEVIDTGSDGRFVVTTEGTERMRITSDAYVRLASGTGGIQFNGDTAAANALDDYEEGTWTPVIGGSTGQSGQTYSVQSGLYKKIGNFVFVSFSVVLTVKGTLSGSNLVISGLPFTVANVAGAGAGSLAYWGNVTPALTNVMCNANINTTSMFINHVDANGGTTITNSTSIVTNSTRFDGFFSYNV
jgi:hypothetical protein